MGKALDVVLEGCFHVVGGVDEVLGKAPPRDADDCVADYGAVELVEVQQGLHLVVGDVEQTRRFLHAVHVLAADVRPVDNLADERFSPILCE